MAARCFGNWMKTGQISKKCARTIPRAPTTRRTWQMSDDVKDIKENCIRREEFVSHQLKLENKLDRLMEFMMKQGGN